MDKQTIEECNKFVNKTLTQAVTEIEAGTLRIKHILSQYPELALWIKEDRALTFKTNFQKFIKLIHACNKMDSCFTVALTFLKSKYPTLNTEEWDNARVTFKLYAGELMEEFHNDPRTK